MTITKGHSATAEYGASADYTTEASWTALAQILDLKEPEPTVDDVEISHMESTNQWKEYTPGWKDGGEFTAKLQFIKATYTVFHDTLLGVTRAYQFTDVDGNIIACNAYLKQVGREIDREGIITVNITGKITGEPDYTAAA